MDEIGELGKILGANVSKETANNIVKYIRKTIEEFKDYPEETRELVYLELIQMLMKMEIHIIEKKLMKR